MVAIPARAQIPEAKERRGRWLRLVLLVVLVAVAVVAAGRWSAIEAWVSDRGALGAVAFAGLFVVLTTGCFPVSVLGVTAGMLYGPWQGLGLVYAAAYVSGVLMFALGRSALAHWTARLIARDRRLQGLEAEAASNALRLNVLARLSPFNYGLVCYTLAAGRTTWPVYLVGLLAAVPSMAAQVWVGHLIRQARAGVVSEAGIDVARTVGAVVAALALALLLWQTGRMVRRSWRGNGTTEPEENREATSRSGDHEGI
ncbi:MAG: TVP38/TMEM64 family protein [bacterium]|nr:TVP38/TMEM64 family protein [bacterium]